MAKKKPIQKKRVLFICTHNSCRSQMAEALLRHRYGDTYESFSAGTSPSRVNPWAIRALGELGVDISGQISDHIEKYIGEAFDTVVTTCDAAKETCPVFPGATRTIHHSFEDPAGAAGSKEKIMEVFRRVRDEIDLWIQEEFGSGSTPAKKEP